MNNEFLQLTKALSKEFTKEITKALSKTDDNTLMVTAYSARTNITSQQRADDFNDRKNLEVDIICCFC